MYRLFRAWCLFLIGFMTSPLLGQEVYVNHVQYLAGSSEFFIEISMLGEWDYKRFQQLENQTLPDQSAISDPSRRHLPLEIARNYFDLSPFQDLLLFNSAHQLVCELTLSEVALFTDYETYFVAILVSQNGFFPRSAVNTDLYCLGKLAENYLKDRFTSSSVESDGMEKRIVEWFSLGESQQATMAHTIIYPASTVYSTLSYIEERPSHTYRIHAYLLETRKGDLSILMNLTNDQEQQYIQQMQPIPLHIHNRPVLLLQLGVLDTDISWHQLALFNGSEYELIEGNWVSMR